MTPLMWTVAGMLATLFLVILVLNSSRAFLAGSANRLGTFVGLTAPDNLATQIADRNGRRGRAVSLGAIVGTAVPVILIVTGVIATSGRNGDPADLWFIIGGAVGGIGVGAAISALRAKPVVPEGERFARAGAVTLEDYIAPVDLIGSRVAVGISVVVLIAAAIVAPSTALSVGGIVIALGVVALVFFEVVIRRILDRAQPVGSPAELAWNDALRARAMRDVAGAPMCLGVWGALALLLNLASSDTGTVVAIGGAILVFGATLAAAAFSIASKPQQHYLRRLWPDVAAAAKAAPVTKAA